MVFSAESRSASSDFSLSFAVDFSVDFDLVAADRDFDVETAGTVAQTTNAMTSADVSPARSSRVDRRLPEFGNNA